MGRRRVQCTPSWEVLIALLAVTVDGFDELSWLTADVSYVVCFYVRRYARCSLVGQCFRNFCNVLIFYFVVSGTWVAVLNPDYLGRY